MAYTTGTIAGTYWKTDGSEAEGFVEIIPSVRVLRDQAGNAVLSGRMKVTLVDGAFTAEVPSSDASSGLDPTGVTYTVVPKLRHAHLRAVEGVYVTPDATVQMADVTTVDPDAPVYAVQVTAEDLAAVQAAAAADAVDLAAEVARATAAEDALSANSVSFLGQVELQPMWQFGHSWQATDTNATAGTRWFQRIISRLRMAAYSSGNNKAVSGRTIGDIGNLALAGANAWTIRTKALVVAICTINDVTLFDGSAASRVGYGHAWRGILATLTANGVVASNTDKFVYSAGWTSEAITGTSGSAQAATANSTGGTRWKTTTVGRYAELTFTGTEVDVFLTARAAGAGLATVAVDGVTDGTLNLTAATAQDCVAVYKVRGESAGTHTVRVTLTSGASLTVDSYRVPSTAPPPVVVCGEPPIIPTPVDHASYLADVVTLKGDLETICAEYPSVLYVDLDQPDWDTATMLVLDSNDGHKHPNDKGCAWIADTVIAAMRTDLGYLTGLNITTSATGYPAAYTAPAGPSIPAGGQDGTGTAGSDGEAPTVPGTPVATLVDGTPSVVTSGSTDNIAVTQYRFYRSGTLVATQAGTTFVDSAAPEGVEVTYTVSAGDAANNFSAQSAASNPVTPSNPAGLVPGFVAHYDATTEPSANGVVVTSWNDEGSGNVDLTATSGPTKRTSPFAYLEFDGTNDFMQRGTNPATPKTEFIVCKHRTGTGGISILGTTVATAQIFGRSSGGLWILNSGTPLGTRTADNNWHVFAIVWNGASSSIQVDALAPEVGTPGANAGGTTRYIGRQSTATVYAIDVARYLSYSGVLSQTDIDENVDYLMSVYGL